MRLVLSGCQLDARGKREEKSGRFRIISTDEDIVAYAHGVVAHLASADSSWWAKGCARCHDCVSEACTHQYGVLSVVM